MQLLTLFTMKKICSIIIAACGYLPAFSQQPPINDTLIPKQHRDDTTQYEPKLIGGALIDTVNIKDTSNYQPGFLKDTLEGKSKKEKPKDQIN
jgi:hypothetical protein